jgi:hypothetical protein
MTKKNGNIFSKKPWQKLSGPKKSEIDLKSEESKDVFVSNKKDITEINKATRDQSLGPDDKLGVTPNSTKNIASEASIEPPGEDPKGNPIVAQVDVPIVPTVVTIEPPKIPPIAPPVELPKDTRTNGLSHAREHDSNQAQKSSEFSSIKTDEDSNQSGVDSVNRTGNNEEKRTDQKPKEPAYNSHRTPRVQLVIGDQLEYRVARMFLKQGYFVRRGINIYTTGYIDTATDIDVLGIKYFDSFGRTIVISECKSGESKPLDRIFWLSGLKGYLNASRAILVRKPTRWNIKDFAKEAGVEVIDNEYITSLETVLEINSDEWLGYSDRQFFLDQATAWNEILRKDHYLAELFLTLIGEARFNEPFGAINYYLHHMRSLTKSYNTSSGARRSLVKYLLGDATAQLVIFIMEICRTTLDLTTGDRRGFIEKKLTHGEMDPNLTQRILDHAFSLSKQAASYYAGAQVDVDKTLFTMPKPDHVEDLTAFVEYLISRMPYVTHLPFACDLVVAETFVKENTGFRLKGYVDSNILVYTLQALDQFVKMLIKLNCLPSHLQSTISQQLTK